MNDQASTNAPGIAGLLVRIHNTVSVGTVLSLYWFLFWLLNGFDKFLNNDTFYGVNFKMGLEGSTAAIAGLGHIAGIAARSHRRHHRSGAWPAVLGITACFRETQAASLRSRQRLHRSQRAVLRAADSRRDPVRRTRPCDDSRTVHRDTAGERTHIACLQEGIRLTVGLHFDTTPRRTQGNLADRLRQPGTGCQRSLRLSVGSRRAAVVEQGRASFDGYHCDHQYLSV